MKKWLYREKNEKLVLRSFWMKLWRAEMMELKDIVSLVVVVYKASVVARLSAVSVVLVLSMLKSLRR